MEERALCTLMCAAYSPLYSAAHAQSTGNVPDISALLSVFSGTMPHARCASHRNGAVHDMVQPPLQSPAVHPHGTASQIETRDHMRIDHKAASGIINNFIRYQKAGICGSHDADQHVCCCTAGSQNAAGTVHTAYSYRAGRVQAKCPGPPCAGILSLLLPIVSATRKSRKPVAANVEPEDSSVE